MSRVVIALGGNALLRRGDDGSIEVQRHNLEAAARAVVAVEKLGHQVVMTHGNGPQVGYLSIEANAAADIVPAPPLDVLVAESQGQIGYLLVSALDAALHRVRLARRVVALLTRTWVDADDPAFDAPSKPVGPVYDRETAERHAAENGWFVRQDGAGWRRVVPSPRPRGLLEAETIRSLVNGGAIVIASGGGGIPVAWDGESTKGIEAVVDKDLAAVLLAWAVNADALLLLTDIHAVQRDWRTDHARDVPVLTVAEVQAGLRSGEFASGSMAPKVEAAASFAAGGGFAAIGALEDAAAILDGTAGTRFVL